MNYLRKKHPKVSVLVPVFNEQESLQTLFMELEALFESVPSCEWEVVLVNDGSRDRSLEMMRAQYMKDNRFRYVDLSRNFGKESAMHAGFEYVDGDCTVIIDADLQHPLSLIPRMIERWQNGIDDVYGHRVDRGKESWLRRKLSMAYYRIVEQLGQPNSGVVIPHAGDFRLLDRRCVEALLSMRENRRYTKGMYSYIGFRKEAMDFETLPRKAGESKQNYLKLFSLAIDGITSYTTMPLRLSTALGFIASISSLLYLVYVVIKTLIIGEPVQGFPSLMVVILFLGGVQLISIGIIGEYIGQIFHESKRRPDFFVRETEKDIEK